MFTGFTRRVEAKLDQVEESHRDWVDVVQSFYEPLERDLATAEERMTHARAEAEPSDYKCPTCQAPMVYRLSKRGKRFLSCSRYPECTGAMNVDREGKPMTVELTEFKCPVCGKFMQKRMGRFGPFLGCSGYPECKTILNLDRKTGQPLPPKPPAEDTGLPCPKCGKKHLLVRTGKRGKFISCGGYPRCRMTLPFERLEELKTAQAQGKWPDDVLAKVGGKSAEVNIADPNEKKPAKKRATKKKAAAPETAAE
jgi:DNA topoisomerase-1